MKVIFMGTPLFGAMILEEVAKENEVVLVITQPDKEVGRKKEIVFSEVKTKAIELGIPVFQPLNIRKEWEEVKKYDFDIIVTAAYGQIVGEKLLEYPKYKAINVHGSLLPEGRGGAPIQRAIMNGDKRTGITIMYMAKGMDNGDIITQEGLDIDIEDNTDTLFYKLGKLGQKMINPVIKDIENGNIKRIKQDESKVTFTYNLTKEDELIDFSKPAYLVNCQIRALAMSPGAFFTYDGLKYKVYSSKLNENTYSGEIGEIVNVTKKSFEILCGDGKSIEIFEIKKEGKNLMKVSEFINGQGRLILVKGNVLNK